jgi:hypothetical protein
MKQIEFTVPAGCDLASAEKMIERLCEQRGLQCAKKGRVSAHPGSIHWHYKRPKQSGTLELTLWPREQRLWAAVHENRRADWVDPELISLRGEIEAALKSTPALRHSAGRS